MPQSQDTGPAQGTIYLNHAPVEDLARLPGLDAARARALVEARPFHAWDDVARAPGVAAEVSSHLQSAGVKIGEPAEGPIGEAGSGGEPGRNLGRA